MEHPETTAEKIRRRAGLVLKLGAVASAVFFGSASINAVKQYTIDYSIDRILQEVTPRAEAPERNRLPESYAHELEAIHRPVADTIDELFRGRSINDPLPAETVGDRSLIHQLIETRKALDGTAYEVATTWQSDAGGDGVYSGADEESLTYWVRKTSSEGSDYLITISTPLMNAEESSDPEANEWSSVGPRVQMITDNGGVLVSTDTLTIAEPMEKLDDAGSNMRLAKEWIDEFRTLPQQTP